jgi:hypothetical protein
LASLSSAVTFSQIPNPGRLNPSRVTCSNTPLSTLEEEMAQKLMHSFWPIGLPLTSTSCNYYFYRLKILQKVCSEHNGEKPYEEIIGKAVVKYSVYPKGTTVRYGQLSRNAKTIIALSLLAAAILCTA